MTAGSHRWNDPTVTEAMWCTAICEPPVMIVYLRGGLSPATAPSLRASIDKCLAQAPAAIILDLAGLALVDDIAVTAFAAAARRAAAWPGIPILLADVPPALAAALARLGVDRQVTLVADVDQAITRAQHSPQPMQLRDRLRPVPAAVPAARDLVTDACTRWRLPQLVDSAGLVASELVTNAVCHAGTLIDLTVTRSPRYLHVAVRDYAHGIPRLVGPHVEDAPGGRGLLLVEALAVHWSHTPTPDGKVTWATLPTSGRRP